MFSLNPSTLMALFQQIEKHGERLIADLTEGGMKRVPEPTAWAQAIAPELPAAPEAAARLRAALRERDGFAPQIMWPELEVIETWKGGASVHYLQSLQARMPDVVLRPALSGSSEGLLMIPLADEWTGGVPALRSSVLEFVPEHATSITPQDFVGLRDLDERTGYRVALTNGRGLYRYLMDDVFLVEGWHQGVPVMRFSHRYGVTSSLTGEKLTEAHVIAASEAAFRHGTLRATDYQLVPAWGEPPRYLLLLETASSGSPQEQADWLVYFEGQLCEQNPEYAAKRASGRLAAPELVLLRGGAFTELARRKAGARSDAQTKTARLSRELADRGFLSSMTIGSVTFTAARGERS
jgi:hypothetical protein